MKIITQPTVEPITVADVKSQLGIIDINSDAILARRIKTARQWAEGYTGRAFITQTIEMRLDCFSSRIELESPPVASVVSVKYIDINGAVQTVSSANYVLDDYPLIPFVRPAFNVPWPTPRDEENAVRVQYVAGYGVAVDVPLLIREAIMIIVGGWMNFQPQAESGITSAKIPNAARQLLDQFVIHKL